MKINPICRWLLILWALTAIGCTGHLAPKAQTPKSGDDKNFVIIKVAPKDSLASLARKYLDDETKAWQIAAFNDIETLKPGQRVAIPLTAPVPGGIGPDGYQTVPVLAYTRVAGRPTNALTVSARNFERQMQFLDENGYTTVSLSWLDRFFRFEEQPPPKAVMVSFDSSQSWVYDIAYPVLKKRGMRGAMFIRTSEIGRRGNLTWEQLSRMSADGFDIGTLGSDAGSSNGNDPRNRLRAMEAGLTAPLKAFKKHLKQKGRWYAYPKGQADDLVISLLKRHGYQSAFTRIRGSNPFFSNPFHLRRALIFGHFDMKQFKNNLVIHQKVDLR